VKEDDLRQAVSHQISVDRAVLAALFAGTARRQRVLLDCPAMAYEPRFFMTPPAPGEPDDFILAPTAPDSGPFSHLLVELLADDARK